MSTTATTTAATTTTTTTGTTTIATPPQLAQPLPLWRRVWEFPLTAMAVAMVLAVAVVALANAALLPLAGVLDEAVLMPLGVVLSVAGLFALQKLVLRRLGSRRHDDLPLVGALGGLGRGTLIAFALFSTIVGIAGLAGAYQIDGWGGLGTWAFLLFGAGIGAGFIEELIFRGILFRWIEEFAGSWAALVLTSALFGLAHIFNDNATWWSSLTIALVAGIMLGGAYMLTRSLWLPIGIHFGWNVTQGLVWDVPVSGNEVDGLVEARLLGEPLLSGGAFGLEASVIALVVAGGFGVWLVKRAADAGEVMPPAWVRRRRAAGAAAGVGAAAG